MKKIIIFLIFCFFGIHLIFASNLRITEVFVDGSDEWVEISNIGSDNFVGSFVLSGIKSSPLSISNTTIPGLSSLLIGDNFSMVSLPHDLFVLGGHGLTLGDTAGVNITLFDVTSSVLDIFIVDQAFVQSLDNTMTSFQKLWNGGGFDIVATLSPFSSGVISPSLASPGKVYLADGSIWFPIFTDVGTGSTSTGSIVTGPINAGSGSSGLTIDCSISWSGVLQVDEIYNGDVHNHYIELLFLEDWSGSLEFSGTALSSGFVLPSQSFKANMRYLVSKSNSGFLHSDNLIIFSDLILLSGGTLIIKDTLTPLLYYANIDSTGQSVYYSNTDICNHSFSISGVSSPGFDRQFLGYLNTHTITNTIIQMVTGHCMSGSNTSTGPTLPPGNTGLNILSGIFNFHDMRISLIDYNPVGSDTNNERIGLTLFTGELLSLSGWSVGYDGKTYKFLSGMIASGTEYIRTANFGLVNSRTVCISLYYLANIIDTVCYDPVIEDSPVYPLVTSTGSIVSGDNETFDYSSLSFDIVSLIYNPNGSDTNNETVVIKFLSGAESILLDTFRLRVGTKNRRIHGTIFSGQTLTLRGNFQMPNSRPTCVVLSYNEIIYDEYCYNPVSSPSTTPNPLSKTTAYTDRLIDIVSLVYDPEGNDTNNETIILLMTGGQSTVDLSKLYLRFGTTKRYLNSLLISDIQTTIVGNYQMPNSKPTCVDLMEGNHIFDTYCYDPLIDKPQKISTGDIQTGGSLTGTDRKEYYSGLQLQRILPNPKDKDIKNFNEKFALGWKNGSGQILTKRVKLLVGKTSISLSGYQFVNDELVIVSSKALINQAACVRLMVDKTQIDIFCYPQAKEGLIYYHPRLETGPQTIPSSLIESLDSQGVDLSDLRLKKSGKQICLTYEKVKIRCMKGGSSSTSAKNRALLTLGNAYIRKMSELVYAKKMDHTIMEQWRKAYRTLSADIKSGTVGTITLYGESIKVTDIESYVEALYAVDENQYMTDQVSRIFFGHQAVDNYYKQLYK